MLALKCFSILRQKFPSYLLFHIHQLIIIYFVQVLFLEMDICECLFISQFRISYICTYINVILVFLFNLHGIYFVLSQLWIYLKHTFLHNIIPCLSFNTCMFRKFGFFIRKTHKCRHTLCSDRALGTSFLPQRIALTISRKYM